MFSQLYIAAQVRNGDIDELFRHETRKHPPALAKDGQIRGSVKSGLLTYLQIDQHSSTIRTSCKNDSFGRFSSCEHFEVRERKFIQVLL